MGLNDYPPVIVNHRHDLLLMNSKKKFNLIQTKKILIDNESNPRSRKLLFQKKKEGLSEAAIPLPSTSSTSAFSETLPKGFLSPSSSSPVSTPTASPPNQKKFNFLLTGNQFSHRTDQSFALFKILFDSKTNAAAAVIAEGGNESIGPVDIVWFTNFISSSKCSEPSLTGNHLTSDELLSSVFTPSFITSIISLQLKQDLERDQSLSSCPCPSAVYPLSLLKAIYKASPSSRLSIAQILLSTSAERVMTCKGALQLSRSEELNINQTTRAVSQSHALGDAEFYLPPERSPPQLLEQSNIPLQSQEHPHDYFLMDLLYFMISVTPINNNSGEDSLLLSPHSLHDHFLRTLFQLLKCYGVRYAKASTEFYDSVVLKLALRSLTMLTARVRGDEVKKLLLAILHAWPSRICVAQQVAFIKALNIILPHCSSLPITNPLLASIRPPLTAEGPAPSATEAVAGVSSCVALPSLASASSPLYKILSRLNQCVASLHLRVCLEILNLFQNDDITSLFLNSNHASGANDDAALQSLSTDLMTKLRDTAESHWNETVRVCSRRCFEKLITQQQRHHQQQQLQQQREGDR